MSLNKQYAVTLLLSSILIILFLMLVNVGVINTPDFHPIILLAQS